MSTFEVINHKHINSFFFVQCQKQVSWRPGRYSSWTRRDLSDLWAFLEKLTTNVHKSLKKTSDDTAHILNVGYCWFCKELRASCYSWNADTMSTVRVLWVLRLFNLIPYLMRQMRRSSFPNDLQHLAFMASSVIIEHNHDSSRELVFLGNETRVFSMVGSVAVVHVPSEPPVLFVSVAIILHDATLHF